MLLIFYYLLTEARCRWPQQLPGLSYVQGLSPMTHCAEGGLFAPHPSQDSACVSIIHGNWSHMTQHIGG